MRGMLENLASPVPMLHQLPGMYQDGDFAARLVSVIDTTFAPIYTTVDNLAAHVDPDTAPEDLLAYVGGWVQAGLDPRMALPEQRRSVREAVALHRRRGTAEGVRRSVAAVVGAPVEVTDSGASTWSTAPGSDLPGTAAAEVTVVVHAQQADEVDFEAVRAVLVETVPAHVQWKVEVVGS